LPLARLSVQYAGAIAIECSSTAAAGAPKTFKGIADVCQNLHICLAAPCRNALKVDR